MMKNKENQQVYNSDFIGYVEDPQLNDSGEMYSLRIRFKDHEIQDILNRYVTPRDEESGKGGNVYISVKKNAKGKWYCTVYNPKAKVSSPPANDTSRATKPASKPAQVDTEEDLPF